ncbi:MAG TPA: TonB-dependent receptor [Woeseiaceae bacterium]|nr:TonB-dependent receptor [Woeseiaceae bacterium]
MYRSPARPAAVNRLAVLLLLAAPATLPPAAAGEAADTAEAPVLEEIVVTAYLRERPASEVPASVTLFDAAEVESLAIQHFEELIAFVPNLNWSGDGHRARYLQIRGVGELEQYSGAPNPSVGFLVDDIDFSGIGTIGTLFDIERVEVLRGPQGTRYGANALAGLVYLQSTRPTPERNGRLEIMAGGDDLFAAGLAFGGALDPGERALYRLSAHHYRSNGFRDNPWLGRDDTNGRDETTLRARLAFEPAAGLAADLALVYADVDDGYDAFALDNDFTVLSDRPGRDAQQSAGASLRLAWRTARELEITSLSTIADSSIDFGFDADWGNVASWAPVVYDYVSSSHRERRTVSQEFRLADANGGAVDWLAGVYVMRLTEALASSNRGDYYDPFYDFAESVDDRLQSDYAATSNAIFGQAEWNVGEASRLTAGVRVEAREADYDDTAGLSESAGETMSGGELAFLHDLSEYLTGYVSLARGFKAGGFNLGVVPAGRRRFEQEVLWNLEAGLRARWFDDRLALDLAVFQNRRDDQQVRTSFQLDPGDPASFVFFTDNAARGTTNGLEVSVRWLPGDTVELYANAGLLDAEFDEFLTPEVDLSGRDQAHAPNYTLAAGAAWRHPAGWFARVDATARDGFYFDVSHDQESDACLLVNARVGYDGRNWRLEFWGRNLTDEYYAVRGFWFGNEPPDFPDTLYTRAGDPRQVGLTLQRSF